MRHRLLVVLALCAAALTAGRASAADPAPTGRWVASNDAGSTILSLYADASFQLTSQKADQPATASTGTYVAKDGQLTLSPQNAQPTQFGYVASKTQLALLLTVDGVQKRIGFARDMGPIVGVWRSDKLDTTWIIAADGSIQATEGGTLSKSTYEVVYVEPAAAEGSLLVHKEGTPSLSFHFTIEEKGSRLVLGGGAGAQDPARRIPLERVGAAPEMPATPATPATPPATAPADGAPKRPKFPAPPKLPGGGGTPVQPTAPVAPTPGTTPAPAPAPAPDAPAAPPPAPAQTGPTWDTTGMTSKGFKILKTTYDADAGRMVWVLEATKDIATYPRVKVYYYDADEIRIYEGSVSFAPSLVAKGERMRAEASLPYAGVLNKVVRIVVVSD